MSVLRIFVRKNKKLPRCAAVIVAAGSSERMGFDKLFADLGGESVIARTIAAFEACADIAEIVIVTRLESVAPIAQICSESGFKKVTKVLQGGSTRPHSALIGVCEVSPATKIIAVHDGARPLVRDELISEVLRAAEKNLAAAPALRAVDTVKELGEGGEVIKTLQRENIALMQTPQAFEANIIKGALTRAAERGEQITDDCAAVEAIGVTVFTVPGDKNNIKLTNPEDFTLARSILEERGEL